MFGILARIMGRFSGYSPGNESHYYKRESTPQPIESPAIPVDHHVLQPRSPTPPLGREEYVEQAHFFGVLGDRLRNNMPTQEILESIREEVLSTTKLPLAIDFLRAELRHEGVFGPAMLLLPHYFTPFQAYVVLEAENERGRFDLRIGLEILRREAEYRAEQPTPQGLFLYQFEAICRNRLGYDQGLAAMANDPAFDDTWQQWILTIRRQVGMVDIADLIYVHSQTYQDRFHSPSGGSGLSARPHAAKHGTDPRPAPPILFGHQEGRIALANRRKDPLYLFASLHRQLGYPEIPCPKPVDIQQALLPQLARRLELLEKRVTLVEDEQRGGFDLTQFYGPPESP
jgi:hypothetical protein